MDHQSQSSSPPQSRALVDTLMALADSVLALDHNMQAFIVSTGKRFDTIENRLQQIEERDSAEYLKRKHISQQGSVDSGTNDTANGHILSDNNKKMSNSNITSPQQVRSHATEVVGDDVSTAINMLETKLSNLQQYRDTYGSDRKHAKKRSANTISEGNDWEGQEGMRSLSDYIDSDNNSNVRQSRSRRAMGDRHQNYDKNQMRASEETKKVLRKERDSAEHLKRKHISQQGGVNSGTNDTAKGHILSDNNKKMSNSNITSPQQVRSHATEVVGDDVSTAINMLETKLSNLQQLGDTYDSDRKHAKKGLGLGEKERIHRGHPNEDEKVIGIGKEIRSYWLATNVGKNNAAYRGQQSHGKRDVSSEGNDWEGQEGMRSLPDYIDSDDNSNVRQPRSGRVMGDRHQNYGPNQMGASEETNYITNSNVSAIESSSSSLWFDPSYHVRELDNENKFTGSDNATEKYVSGILKVPTSGQRVSHKSNPCDNSNVRIISGGSNDYRRADSPNISSFNSTLNNKTMDTSISNSIPDSFNSTDRVRGWLCGPKDLASRGNGTLRSDNVSWESVVDDNKNDNKKKKKNKNNGKSRKWGMVCCGGDNTDEVMERRLKARNNMSPASSRSSAFDVSGSISPSP